MSDPLLCPKCGALIGKHLERCYQCKTYLMGSRLDPWLKSLLPEKAQKNPATYFLVFLSALPFLIVFLKMGPSALSSIPLYTMTQIGATNSTLILMDQYWRFVTANFVHFNALHLLMNLMGLFALGPLIEDMFDYKKCFLIFFSSGTLTFALFFVLSLIFPNFLISSLAGGASAGIFGLLGAGVIGAQKMERKSHLQNLLVKNFIQNLILGLIILPLGSTVLHVLGFGLGCLVAFFIPISVASKPKSKKIFSYLFFTSLIIIFMSFFLQAYELKKYPIVIASDSFKNRLNKCLNPISNNSDFESAALKERIRNCEIIIRMGVNHPEQIVAIMSDLGGIYPSLIDKEKYILYYERMNSLLKPSP